MMAAYKLLINGTWTDALSGKTFDDMNPFTGELYARVACADVADVDRIMDAAFAARKPWSSMPPKDRSKILYTASNLLEQKTKEFADVLIQEGGGTFGKAMWEIRQTVDLIRTAAGGSEHIFGEAFHSDPSRLSYSIRKPWGTVVAISPWNFPLVLSMYKVAYGLATGNTVVLKPSSETPVIGLKIGELLHEAGVLPGAVNVMTGPGSILGEALIKDKRCSYVALTGDTTTGFRVAKAAAEGLKKYTLELGGKNPLIILADADMDFAIDAAAFGCFLHQGQICMSAGRIIIEQKIEKEFSEKLAIKAAALPCGDPRLPSTIVGPLINDSHVKKVDALVKDAVSKGAKLLHGGAFNDRVYEPTVLQGVNSSMRIYHEETFGPVASIISVHDEKEALQVANDTTYGLSSGIVTKDINKALFLAEGSEAGMVHVNDSPISGDAVCPFGGCKLSGIGREGGRYSLEELTQVKWVTIEKGQKKFPF